MHDSQSFDMTSNTAMNSHGIHVFIFFQTVFGTILKRGLLVKRQVYVI